MPRTMWKGAISFGLVSIPVKMYPATEEKSLHFNQLHDEDFGRIRYKRVCEKDGEEVPYEHIVKGYEYEKGHYVVFTDEELDSIPVESTRAIDILQFVDIGDIDPIYFKKTYYLVPDETGVKPYSLLREALGENGKVGIAKVAFREKEHLCALRIKDKAFVLETMHWPDEIRAADFEELDKSPKVRDQELKMAQSLIDSLTEEWDPEEFRDEYREALLDMVEKKVAGEEIEVAEEAEPTKVADLMEALRASVEAAKSSGRKKAPAKRSKKAAAKKAS